MKIIEVQNHLNGDNTEKLNLKELAKKLDIRQAKFDRTVKYIGLSWDKHAKSWLYSGDTSLLETEIELYVEVANANLKQGNNKEINTGNKQESNIVNNEENNNINNIGNNQLNNNTNNNVNNQLIRKNATFNLESELLKELKIISAITEKKTYEIVETAIIKELKRLRKALDQ